MAGRFDVLRSLLHGAADAAKKRVQDLGPIERARHVLEELRQRRARIPESVLSAAVARCPGALAASVRVHDGGLIVDVEHDDDTSLVVRVVPQSARFAPRGAKEVFFAIEPAELAKSGKVRDVVGALAGAVARGLWGPMLPPAKGPEIALTEREGDRLRVDLRSLAAVDSLLNASSIAQLLDVIGIESFLLEDHALQIRIALPSVLGG